MWIGISLTIIVWLALTFQASKRLSAKDKSEKFTQKKRAMQLYRNYCLERKGYIKKNMYLRE